MRSFFPFAALLGVALVLACQDVGTGPDGLVPQFDKKDLDRVGAVCPDGDDDGPFRDDYSLLTSRRRLDGVAALKSDVQADNWIGHGHTPGSDRVQHPRVGR